MGKPKDAHVQVYPTTPLVHTPPQCDMVCLQDLAAGAPADHSFFPFSWHLANPRWWDAAEAVERAEGAEAPAPPGDKGGASAAGVRYLLAGAQAWHAQAEACAGQMSAVSTGLRMAMMASGKQVDVDSVAPDAPKVTAAMEEVRRQYPPHRLTSAAMDPSFVESVARSRAPRAPLAGALLQGGGGA